MDRRLLAVFGSEMWTAWSATTRGWRTATRAAARSTSTQRSPEEFAAAHTGGGSQQPGGVLAITLDVAQEGAELGRGPNLELGWFHLRRIGGIGDVADDVAPAHRIPERTMDQDVDVSDRLGRQAARPVAPAGSQQVPV